MKQAILYIAILTLLISCRSPAARQQTSAATDFVDPTVTQTGSRDQAASTPTTSPIPLTTTSKSPTERAPTAQVPETLMPFERVELQADFRLDGAGRNVDTIAFWETDDPTEMLLFVTAKANQLVEVWQYPFVDNELAPLTHSSFGTDTQVNGVFVDQQNNQLLVVVSEPASAASLFQLPELSFSGQFVSGEHDLGREPNVALLNRPNGESWVYLSSPDTVYIYDMAREAAVGQFKPAKGLETMLADSYHGVIYIPDENDRTGVYAYQPDGTPYLNGGSNNFGRDLFASDAEGILLYACHTEDGQDDGRGFLVVADQRRDKTEFEFFDRSSWRHLGTMTIAGVSNTDGIASTQQSLPDYPGGIFAAIDDDEATVGVGWEKIFRETGLQCGITP